MGSKAVVKFDIDTRIDTENIVTGKRNQPSQPAQPSPRKRTRVVSLPVNPIYLQYLEDNSTLYNYSNFPSPLRNRSTHAPSSSRQASPQDRDPPEFAAVETPTDNAQNSQDMPTNFRNPNRRQNRPGYVDHDQNEGLPVKHWRRDYTTFVTPPAQDTTATQNDIWAVELPHGMPKDSHLLPQHSQDLLRAARSGKIFKRPAPVEEEEADAEAILGDKPEKKEEDARERGFTAKTWKQVPRPSDGPGMEYLAKRRKGLITLSKTVAPGPTLTKAKVRKVDAAGNPYTQEVIVPTGQQVEGEVISTTTIPAPAAVEMVAQPTPPRRKGAPPKSKKSKIGRSRKKKPAAPTSVPLAAPVDGLARSVEGAGSATDSNAVKIEGGFEDGSVPPLANEDTEMGEGSNAASDDEDGEEGDDVDDDEGSLSAQESPSKPPRTFSPAELPHMREIPRLASQDTEMGGTDDLPGPPLPNLDTTADVKAGSPLKHIALTTETPTLPSEKVEEPNSSAPLEVSKEPAADIADTNAAMLQDIAGTAPESIPEPPPNPTETEVISAIEAREEEEEEETMLLDVYENTNNAGHQVPEAPEASEPISTPVLPKAQIPVIAPEEPHPAKVLEEPMRLDQPTPTPVSVPVPVIESVEEQTADDDGYDLLGGLEEKLKDPQAGPASEEKKVESEGAQDA